MSKVAPEPIVEKEEKTPVSSGEKKEAEEKTLETKVDAKTTDNVNNTAQNVNNDKESLDKVAVDKQDTKINLDTKKENATKEGEVKNSQKVDSNNDKKKTSTKVVPLDDSMDEALRKLEEEEAKLDAELSEDDSDDDDDDGEEEELTNEQLVAKDLKKHRQSVMMPKKFVPPPPPPTQQKTLQKANEAWGKTNEEESESEYDDESNEDELEEEEKEEVEAIEDELNEEGAEGLGKNYLNSEWKMPQISIAHSHGKKLRFAEGAASMGETSINAFGELGSGMCYI